MTDIPVEIQTQILQQKIQFWLNTEFDAQLDAEVAQDLLGSLEARDDPRDKAQIVSTNQMLTQATQRMKSAKRAIVVLEKKLSTLGGGSDG